jgi:polyhydroxybutyrate depolymerase
MIRLRQVAIFLIALLFLGAARTAEPLPIPPGDYEFRVHHGAKARSYLLHVPPRATTGRPLPLLIAFHGGGSSASGMKNHYGIDRLADRFGYLVAYPNGSGFLKQAGLSWNAGQCCGYALERKIDDTGFTAAVIDDVAKRIPIDPKHVFAAGHSNGAMMAHRVAIDLGDRVVAIAAVAGSLVYGTPRRTTPRSVLVIHSIDDPLALYQGGEGPRRPLTGRRSHHEPVENTVKWWAKNNGCAGVLMSGQILEQMHSKKRFTAQKIEHDDCRDGSKVAFWKLSGTGHAWPGQKPILSERVMGPYRSVIDANEEIFSFFNGVTP